MNSNFYRAFEDKFRGSRDLVKSRLRVYLPFVLPLLEIYPAGSALDLGCGRGEWLELLQEHGFDAQGIDLDRGMLQACHELGLKAREGDALALLKATPDSSLLVVSGFHLAEHLPFEVLQEIFIESKRALKAGGLLILETPNPENIFVSTNSFYLDPTHKRPIPMELLSFLPECYGYIRCKVVRLQESAQIQSKVELSLMDVISSVSPDYAIVAQTDAPSMQLDALSSLFDCEYGVSLHQLADRYHRQIQSSIERLEAMSSQNRQIQSSIERLEAITNQSLLELNSVYKSSSWRITAPCRWVSSCIRYFLERLIKLSIVLFLQHVIDFARERPRLKCWLRVVASKIRPRRWGFKRLDEFLIDTLRKKCDTKIELAPVSARSRYIYVDVSGVYRNDLRTGIQRVVRGLFVAMLDSSPAGFEVRAVYAHEGGYGYCHATNFMQQTQEDELHEGEKDSPIRPEFGDIFLGLDYQAHAVVNQESYLLRLNDLGIKVCFVVYDLLPVLHPEWFPEGSSLGHAKWLETILKFDKAICISNTVANDLKDWAGEFTADSAAKCSINTFPMGADLENTEPTTGMPDGADKFLDELMKSKCFLMVGTVEPRKGHEQVLLAFEKLWAEGGDECLVVVGKEGWKVDALVERMSNHVELGRRFHWLRNISDEYLEKIYSVSTCLIAASYAEGYGLPIIEASKKGVPVFARDIAAFREVGGASAIYFKAETAEDLANALVDKRLQLENRRSSAAESIACVTWSKSAEELCRITIAGG